MEKKKRRLRGRETYGLGVRRDIKDAVRESVMERDEGDA